MSKVVHVGIVGFGLSGRYFHTPFLSVNPKFNLKKIASSRPEAVQAFNPSIESVATAEELFADPDIDLVFVCSPNDTHVEYARKALQAGKNVVVEKPFALTEKEAVELLQLAEDKHLLATAYQNRRWDSDFLTIKRLLAEGALGTLIDYEGRYDRFSPIDLNARSWKEQPGVGRGNLYNLGPHILDQALHLFGTPETVQASVRMIRPGSQVHDYFDIKLGYADKNVRLESSLMVYHNQLRYSLHGTDGSFIKGGLDVQEERLRLNELPGQAEWGAEPQDRWGTLYRSGQTDVIASEAGNYTPFYDNLYDVIVNGATPYVTPADIQRLARVIDLAQASSQSQRTLTY
jgi:predicted dehydrogenase